jgi:hypothetical protein
MRNTITRLDPNWPLINQQLRAVDTFRIFLLEVAQRGLLIGTGSPEGVVEAQQGVEYMDDAGTAGNIKYIKRDADVAGDRTKGWILI